MTLTKTRRFEAPPEVLLHAYTQREGILARYAAIGAQGIELLDHELTLQGARVRVSRVVDVEIPAFAQRFIQPRNTIVETDLWTGLDEPVKRCRYEVEIRGTPIRMTGEIVLSPADGGTEEVVTAEVSVKIPLVGKKVAAIVEEVTSKSIDEEFDYLGTLRADQ